MRGDDDRMKSNVFRRLTWMSLMCTALPIYADAPRLDEAEVYRARLERLLVPGAFSNQAVYDFLEPVPGAADSRPLPVRDADARTIDAAALDAARAYAAARNSNAFIVWRDGAIEYEQYFGDFERTDFTISKSLAKPLTSIAIGRAIALGHIRSLDQPVADFITEWRGSDKAAILVRHLLDMRSGLLAQGAVDDAASIWTRSYLGTRHDEVIINEYPLTNTPGTYYNYSNATADLVAPLLERASGMRYAEFLSQHVFKPLGAPGGEVWVNRPGGTAHSGCCLLAPAEVWLRLAILLLDDGVWEGERLLPAGYAATIRTPTAAYVHAALGLYVAGDYVERRGAAHPSLPFGRTLHSEPYLARDLYLFDGNSNQVVYIVPSLRLIVLRTGDSAPRDLPEWDNAFLPNTIMRGASLRPGESPPIPQPR